MRLSSVRKSLPHAAVGLLALLIPFGMVATGLGQVQPAAQTMLPIPPRVFIDTSYRQPSGRTIPVARGGDLQGALKAAQPGDVLVLEPGATFQGNFSLPNKVGTAWIVVRSGASDDKLPAPGTRVTPGLAPLMPKIVSPNGNPALYTEAGAHHYRFVGIEFTIATSVKDVYSIVAFGGEQTADADTPRDLILDRCYVHGHPETMSRRGVLLNGASSAVIDSHVSEIHAAGADSQAILGYNGPGPFKIINNYREATTENLMFGGADPTVPNLVPSDIEIRQNHIFKPLRWRPGDPSFAGVSWPIKNLLELKNAQRVLIEGNLLENNWGGAALVLTPRNQDGRAPWSVVQDVFFRSNIVKNALSGFSLQTSDDERSSQPTKRIALVNNAWGVTKTFFGLTGGRGGVPEDLLIDHNTAIPGGYSAYYIDVARPPAMVRFRLTNNLIGFGSFGVSSPKGDPKWLPAATIARNALVSLADTGDGQGSARNRPPDIDQMLYTSYPNAAAAGLNPDGTLAPKSPNRRAGTDGKDIGVDFDELLSAYTPPSPRK
jgi:hypothetical protein